VLLALLIAGTITLVTRWTKSYWIAELDRTRIAELADDQIEPHLRKLAAQGKPGWSVLIEILGDQSAAVRGAAVRVLADQIQRRSSSTRDEATEQLDTISALLAAHAVHLHGEGLRLAADLAERIIDVSAQASPTTTNRLRHCHFVLAARASELLNAKGSAVELQKTAADRFARDDRKVAADPSPMAIDIAPILDGGGLPAAPVASELTRLPEELVAEAKPLIAGVLPLAMEPTPKQAAAVDEAELPGGPSQLPSEWPAMAPSAHDKSGSSPPSETSGLNALDHAQRNGQLQKDKTKRPIPQSLARLLAFNKQLSSSDDEEVMLAMDEMEENDIDPTWLKLARGAVDPDPLVRKELVEALPFIGEFDTQDWFLWLSMDEHVEVRRAALTLMATSNDPVLKKRVREAADGDSDPRIRAQARASLTTNHRATTVRKSKDHGD
jgi:hypothetical protein